MPEKIVSTLLELSHNVALPLPVLEQMVKQGMPIREDGSYDVNEIRAWRDEKLVGMAVAKDKMGSVEKFRVNRADIYAIEQAESLRLQGVIRRRKFTLKDIDDMSIAQASALYDALRKDQKDKFEQERLERGQSTENVSVIVSAIKELKRKRRGGEKPKQLESVSG